MSELDDIEREIQRAERALKRARGRLADWKNPEDKRLYVRDLKRKQRRAELDELVPHRICPGCDRTIAKSRSWVITSRVKLTGIRHVIATRARKCMVRGKTALCRSCWTRIRSS